MKKFFLSTTAILVLSIFSSQCFAQSQTPTADAEMRRQKQYLDVINSLYYFIQQNYVEEVDPQKLYAGA